MNDLANLDLAPVAQAGLSERTPVIDLGGGLTRTAVDQIAEACGRWGFFQVVGHGVAPDLVERTLAETRGFFAEPKAAKRALLRTRDNPWGFYDRELTKTARDKKEIFDIGPPPAPLDPFSGGTPWPASRPSFEATVRPYFEACERLSADLVRALCLGLGARADRLEPCFAPTHTSFLRLNHYPVADPLEGEAQDEADLGIHHHTDAGAVTVLLQDVVSGLQVYRDGAWYGVDPVDGALTVNIGDMVQVWSNDRYPAPVHRVLAMQETERFSLPFFYNPSYAALVAPLAEAVGPGGAAKYRPISWGEFRRRRADGDFADYGAEVQIADYRRA